MGTRARTDSQVRRASALLAARRPSTIGKLDLALDLAEAAVVFAVDFLLNIVRRIVDLTQRSKTTLPLGGSLPVVFNVLWTRSSRWR